MQAIIQSLGAMVMALATAAFAHFGIALKDCGCPKAPQAIQHVAYAYPVPPGTIRHALSALASEAPRA
ncbi:MAG TPA: hypothetical protein VHX64_00585 [Caulobacteraceae bacterium]|jgi:hypothetical protein|nr:hypothetical protein [Caulobacteraceae bacterium]